MDVLGKIVAAILAVLFIFVSPLQYIMESSEFVKQNYVSTIGTNFVDHIRTTGSFSIDDYEELKTKLYQTGHLYDVELEHVHPVKTYEVAESISENLDCSFFSSDSATVETLSTVQSSSTHVHTDECYAGHTHTGSKTFSGTASATKVHTYDNGCYHYHYCYYPTVMTTGSTVLGNIKNNGLSYYCKIPTYYIITNKGSKATHTVSYEAVVEDDTISFVYVGTNVTNSPNFPETLTLSEMCSLNARNFIKTYSGLEPSTGGSNYIEMSDYSWISLCDETTNGWTLSCGQEEYQTLMCDQIITSITANSSTQTVLQGESIDQTATVTYLDGTTGTVDCTTDFTTSSTCSNKKVTLTYYGYDTATTQKNFTCTTTVTVKSPKVLSSIEPVLSSDSIHRYEAFPMESLTLNYSNGDSSSVTSGWTVSGFDNTQLGSQTVTISYTEDGTTKTAKVSIIVKVLSKICSICGNVYDVDTEDFDQGCPICYTTLVGIKLGSDSIEMNYGDTFTVTVSGVFRDGHLEEVRGWTSDYDPEELGSQLVTVLYEGFSATVLVNTTAYVTCPVCGAEYELNEDGSDPGCPYCNEQVVSLIASPTTQSVEFAGELSLTVIACYKDGHQEAITGWESSFDSRIVGEQNVIISYGGISTSVTVTVTRTDTLTTCPICGKDYDTTEYPTGCPYCSTTLTGIKAELINQGTKVQLGSDLNLMVFLIYRDSHQEMIYEGFTISDYEKYQLGYQTVTITYEDYSCTLAIQVVNTLLTTTCENGHVYYLNEDGSDPGCPYCNSEEIEGDDTVLYLDITYTSDILESLYESGTYDIPSGDYINITFTRKDSVGTQAAMLLFFHVELLCQERKYTYGGEVQ